MIAERIVLLLGAVVVVLAATYAYLRGGDRLLAALPQRWHRPLLPWLFVAPAVAVVALTLAVPAASTIGLSVLDADGGEWVGLANYADTLADPVTRTALRNTVLWVVLLPSAAVLVGLTVAVLAERVRYAPVVRAALFLPIAVSAVAAGVVWSFMYDYQPAGAAQTGTLNAVLTVFPGLDPVAWLISESTGNPALIAATLWTQAGFAMVVFDAALRAVPAELHEAARLDGASEWGTFRYVTLPCLMPTVVVVATTMTIVALKAFDLVYVMTNGNHGTDVLSTVMYRALFTGRDGGIAAAVATVLMLAVVPIMVFNVRQFRRSVGEA
ncbi:sugar ABC transporter permease [Actinomycetes bacterium KLBMP 9759]